MSDAKEACPRCHGDGEGIRYVGENTIGDCEDCDGTGFRASPVTAAKLEPLSEKTLREWQTRVLAVATHAQWFRPIILDLIAEVLRQREEIDRKPTRETMAWALADLRPSSSRRFFLA